MKKLTLLVLVLILTVGCNADSSQAHIGENNTADMIISSINNSGSYIGNFHGKIVKSKEIPNLGDVYVTKDSRISIVTNSSKLIEIDVTADMSNKNKDELIAFSLLFAYSIGDNINKISLNKEFEGVVEDCLKYLIDKRNELQLQLKASEEKQANIVEELGNRNITYTLSYFGNSEEFNYLIRIND